MLLQFGVENHRSMRGRQSLSLIASALRDQVDGLIKCSAAPNEKILPSVVIYGANASGKSNLVSAISFMRSAVLHSHRRGDPGGKIARRPFSLDPKCEKEPTVFDVDFIVDQIRYHYGFEFTDDEILTEWLFSFPSNRRQLLFERARGKYKFGRSLKGQNRVISNLTRENSLFLSAAFQNGHEQLSKVAEFFRSIESNTNISVEDSVAAMRFLDHEVDTRVIDFLTKLGTGVVDARRIESEIDDRDLTIQDELTSVLKKILPDGNEFKFPDKVVTLELAHRSLSGEPVFFRLNQESAGTRRLLLVLGELYNAIDKGSLVLVDELDASLHTQACEALIGLFSSRLTNPNGAQLIATTNDTNLLSCPLLRRDQIWFTEKDEHGSTHLYPLTDIRTRKGDNIERGYLQGRYGAIPFAGSIPDLLDVG